MELSKREGAAVFSPDLASVWRAAAFRASLSPGSNSRNNFVMARDQALQRDRIITAAAWRVCSV
jgi:hypothetical protein